MKRNLMALLMVLAITLSLTGCGNAMRELRGTAKPESNVTEKVSESKAYNVSQDKVLAAAKKVLKAQDILFEVGNGEDKNIVRITTEAITIQNPSLMRSMMGASTYTAKEIIDVTVDGIVSFAARFSKALGVTSTKRENLKFPEKENELRKQFFDALDKEVPSPP